MCKLFLFLATADRATSVVPLFFTKHLQGTSSRGLMARYRFRWAELQLHILSQISRQNVVDRRLGELESQIGNGLPSLDQAYEEMDEMNTPQPHIRELAERVTKWLLLPRTASA